MFSKKEFIVFTTSRTYYSPYYVLFKSDIINPEPTGNIIEGHPGWKLYRLPLFVVEVKYIFLVFDAAVLTYKGSVGFCFAEDCRDTHTHVLHPCEYFFIVSICPNPLSYEGRYVNMGYCVLQLQYMTESLLCAFQ